MYGSKLLLIVLLITLPLLASCADTFAPHSWKPLDNKSYYVFISPKFSSKQQQELRQAVLAWHSALDGFISFQEIDNADRATIDIEPSTTYDLNRPESLAKLKAEESGKKEPGLKVLGSCFHHGEKSTIIIASDLDGVVFFWTAIHELGHSIGLAHSETATVMCSHAECGSSTITVADINQFKKVWKIK